MFPATSPERRRPSRRLAVALALLLGLAAAGRPTPAAAQEGPAPVPSSVPAARPEASAGDLAARIEAYVADAWPAHGPGAAVVVTRDGEPIVAAARGRADVQAGDPLAPGTVFMLGSTTKQFTAAVVMQLAEEEAIELDAPLADYLPAYRGPNPDATLRQLLAHTAGVPDMLELPGWDREGSSERPRTTAELIDVFEGEEPAFEPGSDWDYSNSNYVLLGAVIESVTGEAWHEAVRGRIAEPLGLETLRYGEDPEVRAALAEGYTSSDSGQVPADDVHASNAHAAGGLVASVRDLAEWMHALHTGRVVSRESFEAMTTPGQPNDPVTPYGFGLRIEKIRGHRTITHGGLVDGYSSQTVWAPEEDLYVAVLSNSDDPAVSPETASRRIAARVLGDPYPTFEAVEPDMERIEPLLGRYEIRGSGDTRAFYARGGKLYTLRSGSSESRLYWAGNDRFFYGPGSLTWFRVVRGGDGEHRMEMHQQGAAEAEVAVRTGPVDRPDFVELPAERLDEYVGRYRLRPDVFVHVTRTGDGLSVRLTGQSAVPIRPVSETGFRLQGIDAEVVFRREGGEVTGLVIHQGGEEIPARRVGG